MHEIEELLCLKNGTLSISQSSQSQLVLNLEVIAEGVETKEQLECLVDTQCNIIQGYYFSKPLTTSVLEQQWIVER